MKSLKEIKSEIDRLVSLLGDIDFYSLPTYGRTDDGARPHIEVDTSSYHYVIVERGHEQDRETSVNLDDLLYWVFRSITFNLACKFELKYRIEEQDSRRILFAKHLELLNLLEPEWAERRQSEMRQILKKAPFDNASSVRARYSIALRRSGHSDERAWEMACQKYPKSQELEDMIPPCYG